MDELLCELRRLDAAAHLEPIDAAAGKRYCTTVRCLCGYQAVLHGHRVSIGHASLDSLDASKVCARIASTACSCCKGIRARAKHAGQQQERLCYTCGEAGHLVRDCPNSHCSYCGAAGHLARDCKWGSDVGDVRRSQQFLTCDAGERCFVRRIVVPLHSARADFDLDRLREGRIDLAARLVCATLMASQRLRHNAQLWLPFLGEAEPDQFTLCVTGGTVRGLHPAERDTATRIRGAIDALRGGAGGAGGAAASGGGNGSDAAADGAKPSVAASSAAQSTTTTTTRPAMERELRGFRVLPGGYEAALRGALEQAREGGTKAPLLLLVQGAPPLADVLRAHFGAPEGEEEEEEEGAGTAGKAAVEATEAAEAAEAVAPSPSPLRDMVVSLGDNVGLTAEDEAVARRVGAEAGGGGPVLAASLGSGCLLASHCVVILHHYLDAYHECPPQLWAAPPPEVGRMRRQHQRKTAARRQRQQQQQQRQQHEEEEVCIVVPSDSTQVEPSS